MTSSSMTSSWMTGSWFIHLHVDGLNVTPHHQMMRQAITSETDKVKEDLEIIHRAFPLGRTSSGNTKFSCGWSTGANHARSPSFRRMFFV